MTEETGKQQSIGGSSLTLGALLYADKTRRPIPESEWVGLVQSIAAGNLRALGTLYGRTHRLVHTLISRIASDPEIANEGLLEVFYDIWRKAPVFNPDKETTIAWITNQARSRAVRRQRLQRVTRPATSIEGTHHASNELWARLGRRIALETGSAPPRVDLSRWQEPDWNDVAPGISCKLLATDDVRHRVSMLVRLAPGIEYPPHTHAGLEELHLLEGELWIDEKKLYSGDYNRAEAGTADKRVWTETGCSCVLITSTDDVIG